MPMNSDRTMRGMALDRFGGPEVLTLHTLPLPEVGTQEVLIRVEVAGVGTWDPFEREGGYAQVIAGGPRFPYVLGSEGAGIVAGIGEQVRRFAIGDRVYASAFLNAKGGFYAEYVAVDERFVSLVPNHLTIAQAGVMAGVGITALRGLDDILRLQAGESILIVGASGGIGHIAVQLARQMGTRVCAIASGVDGVALVEQLGCDCVVDGRQDDVGPVMKACAPEGFDAVLLTVGGAIAEQAIQSVRPGGRVAYPNGIYPEPRQHVHVQTMPYNGEPDPDIVERFDRLVTSGHCFVHIAQTFPLEQAQDAHRALESHYLGKLALRVDD